MIYYFLYGLKNKIFIFNILRYITFRSIVAFFTAFIIGVIIAPYLIKKFKTIGIRQSAREWAPASHNFKSGTPTMGGVFIILSAIISILLWSMFNPYVWLVTMSLILFGGIGFLDDYLKIRFSNSKGVTARLKLILQVGFSILLIGLLYLIPEQREILWKFYIPYYSKPLWVWSPFIAILFFVFTMVSFSNATNLSDGLDGLATGMGIFLYIPFGIIAYIIGNAIASNYLLFPYIKGVGELAVVISAILGGFTAFLWFNVHPAQIFMGDTGSLAMGGTIALIAIILKQEILLLIAGGVFVIETLSVVIQVFSYKKFKKRVFKMAPIHHHFELSGWIETQVVIRFWIVSALFALIALTSLKIR